MEEIKKETKQEAPYKEPPSGQQVIVRLGVMAILILILAVCVNFLASDDSEDLGNEEESMSEESDVFDSLPGASGQ
jgi:hypothetical protein